MSLFIAVPVHKHFTQVWLDTDEVRIYIAEIIHVAHKGWELHMRTAADVLKDNTTRALKVFADEQINNLKILERLTS